MAILYLIISHTNPRQIERLVARLRKESDSASIVIHHSPTGENLNARRLENAYGVRFVPNPIACRWGDFSLVQATLNSLRWIEQSNIHYEWLVQISGQDYPVKPAKQLQRELFASEYDAYVNAFSYDAPDIWPRDEGFTRYFFQYFALPRFRYWHKVSPDIRLAWQELCGIFNRCQRLVRLIPAHRNRPPYFGIRRRHPSFNESFRCLGGDQWFNLRRTCARHLLDYLDAHPDILRLYRRTLFPEESIFASVLHNAAGFRVSDTSRRFIHWGVGHKSSPGIIGIAEAEIALRSGADFARKFDLRVDPPVFDHIDGRLDAIGRQS